MKKKLDEEIGERLKSRRIDLALSRDDLAKYIGVTSQQIKKYEAGAGSLNTPKLYSLAILLEVPVSYFFDGKLTPVQGKPLTSFADKEEEYFCSDREILEVMKVFNKVECPDIRKKILELLDIIGR